MAPPANRRSGSNRKDQMGLFAGYLAAILGALFGAALLIISLWRPDAFAGLRTMAADAVAPAAAPGAAGRSGSRGFFEAIAGYYRDQAVSMREKASAQATAAVRYEALFGPEADLVSGARLLAHYYEQHAQELERIAEAHAAVDRNRRRSQAVP